MILRQILDILVPKYIETISFVFHCLEQIQRVDWGAIVFGSWVDVSGTAAPDSLKRGRETLQARLWKGMENRGFNQIQKFLRPNASNKV